MPCNMVQVACCMVAGVGAWSMAMKSLTKTSRICASLAALLVVICRRFSIVCTGVQEGEGVVN